MNFFNFLTQNGSVLNFNLNNITNGFGLGNPTLTMNTSKAVNTEQVIKEPSALETATLKAIEPQKEANQKESQVQLFTQQQQLINQYMHLNIQLLSKKLENLEHIEKIPKKEEVSEEQYQSKSNKKKIKKMNSCGHQDKEHYAKGMCSNCYHKYGRTKKPWNCPHGKLYANGMCQNCYINTYNRKRRQERDVKNEDSQVQSELKIEENMDE